ncbi:hypothetical protein Xhom_04156 [Xenorhabdus hominickii]|uniref:Uncharacterized protein n=1 Tax=Xenorhabdus hominickii TaxID=351679 RepID=A0A2G0Q230_XENHO|nr:hypothetical protein Xhom_04156 [Xenorhabdus hominickii]
MRFDILMLIFCCFNAFFIGCFNAFLLKVLTLKGGHYD